MPTADELGPWARAVDDLEKRCALAQLQLDQIAINTRAQLPDFPYPASLPFDSMPRYVSRAIEHLRLKLDDAQEIIEGRQPLEDAARAAFAYLDGNVAFLDGLSPTALVCKLFAVLNDIRKALPEPTLEEQARGVQ